MRINFDFTDLQVFLAVLETGSFHGAGERLALSQPSVTRRIRKLEESLGSALFERTTRAVHPTLAAKRLRVSAEAMLDSAFETTRAMRDESQASAHQRAQILTVATIPTVVQSLFIPALREVQSGQAGLRVRLMDLSANDVAEAVAAGEAEVGVTSVALHDSSTRFERLFSDPIVLAMRSDHPLAARGRLDWRELEGHRLILPARGTGNRLLIDDALARAAIGVHWTVEVGRSTTALQLVKDGIGVAFLPRISLRNDLADGVVWSPIGAPEILRPIGLLTRTAQKPVGTLARLIAALRSTGRTLPEFRTAPAP